MKGLKLQNAELYGKAEELGIVDGASHEILGRVRCATTIDGTVY